MHKKFYYLLVAGLLVLAVCLTYNFFAGAKVKQVLVITIDTLRADHLSSYGYPLPTTPFVDSLAEQGSLFENALSVSSHTAPSHTTMFTGVFPFQHRVLANHDRLASDIPSIYTALSKAGFDVAAFSAVQFMEGKVGFPNIEHGADLPGSEVSRKYWFRSGETQVNRLIHWFKNRKGNNPFFAWLHFYDVHAWQHRHGQVPDSYFSQMMPTDIEKHADFLEQQHGIPVAWHKSAKEMVAAISGYDARLRYVDDQIKRLSEFMDSQGLWQDTLVVVLSDHGEGLGNHNYAGHGKYIYNEQLHVPMLFSKPNGRLGKQRIANQVRTVDLFPTLVDFLELPLPTAKVPLQGVSLRPVIEGQAGAQDRLHEFSFAERRPRDETRLRRDWKKGEFHALQNDRWKLILHSLGEHELYDLKNDRFELNNVLGSQLEHFQRYKAIIETILKLPRAGEVVPEDLNEAQLEELRSLGYL